MSDYTASRSGLFTRGERAPGGLVGPRAGLDASQKSGISVFRRKWTAIITKVKQPHYRPGQALRVPGGWASKISRQSALEGGKPYAPAAFPPPPPPREIFRALISVTGWVDARAIVRPKGLCQWKIPVTPSRIEPATFRFVVQCLSNCAIACPALITRKLDSF
jgi:hypothetical protein